ncbi:hypothetical protein CspHIS471_0603560 [Cutaneotrichosporon sp. HIS471]|nr:hypothetical protein CspHIS471_0603560 [Cutaneotrichosporon sp. HIS471]
MAISDRNNQVSSDQLLNYTSTTRDVLHRLLNRRTRGGPASSSTRRPLLSTPTHSPKVSSEPPGSVNIAHHGIPNSSPPLYDPTAIQPALSGISPGLNINASIRNNPLPTGPITSELNTTGTLGTPPLASKASFPPQNTPSQLYNLTNTTNTTNTTTNKNNNNMSWTDSFVPLSAFEDEWSEFMDLDNGYSSAAVNNDGDDSPASAALGLTPQDQSPTDSDSDSPKLIDSEPSKALVDSLFNSDEMPASDAGILHEAADLINALFAGNPLEPANPMFASSFNSTFNDAGLDAGTQPKVDLDDILRGFEMVSGPSAEPVAPTTSNSDADGVDVAMALQPLHWVPTFAAGSSTPASPFPATVKRKVTEIETETETEYPATKRARSSTPVVKRPYRRQSAKNNLTLSQLAAAASSGSSLVLEQLEDDEAAKKDTEVAATIRLTSTGKPSTARPKAVVPEKYMKNGEAQTITGMSTEQILAYPNWEALMQDVDEEHRANALAFGKMITDNRDKAKWAAKKSRDERKQKVEQLEGQVDELEKKNDGMRKVLLGLVRKGLVDISEIQEYI